MNEKATHAARKRALLEEFRRILPAASVLHTEETLKPGFDTCSCMSARNRQ